MGQILIVPSLPCHLGLATPLASFVHGHVRVRACARQFTLHALCFLNVFLFILLTLSYIITVQVLCFLCGSMPKRAYKT